MVAVDNVFVDTDCSSLAWVVQVIGKGALAGVPFPVMMML